MTIEINDYELKQIVADKFNVAPGEVSFKVTKEYEYGEETNKVSVRIVH